MADRGRAIRPKVIQLSLSQRIALAALESEQKLTTLKIAGVLTEIGVDPAKNWRVTEAGLQEVDEDGAPAH